VREFWRIDVAFEHPDGRVERVRKVFTGPKRDAEALERQIRSEMIHPRPPKEAPTFKQFVDETWWPTYPTAAANSHTTIREKQSHLELHLVPFFGAKRLDAINKALLERFVAAMYRKTKGKTASKTLSPKRVKNVLATLRRALVSAVEWDILEKVPKFPRIKAPEHAVDFFTREESTLVINAARNAEERALLMFAFHTGARAGEQIAFEWGELDLRNRFVCLRRSSTDGTVRETTKSGKPRKVPLTASLEAALRDIRHVRGPLVFCQKDGSPMTLWMLHERLWSACRRAGLRRIRWHDCRHSFASQLVMANTPLRQVQEWLGHSTITMTMRYAHLAPGGGREYLSALEQPNHGHLTATRGGAISNSA
jgi:integrase